MGDGWLARGDQRRLTGTRKRPAAFASAASVVCSRAPSVAAVAAANRSASDRRRPPASEAARSATSAPGGRPPRCGRTVAGRPRAQGGRVPGAPERRQRRGRRPHSRSRSAFRSRRSDSTMLIPRRSSQAHPRSIRRSNGSVALGRRTIVRSRAEPTSTRKRCPAGRPSLRRAHAGITTCPFELRSVVIPAILHASISRLTCHPSAAGTSSREKHQVH